MQIFYSYSHKNEIYLKELQTHFRPLVSEFQVKEFVDKYIDIGDKISESISKNLLESDLIILLISAEYLASSSCLEEMNIALEHNKAFPIILDYCDWKNIKELKAIKALPKDGRPINAYPNKNEAYHFITKELRKKIENTRNLTQKIPNKQEIAYKSNQKDIYGRLCEYLILPNQWDFDEKGAFCKIDPNFEIIDINDDDLQDYYIKDANEYDWLNSIHAISKNYKQWLDKSLPIQHIKICYNQRQIYSTFLYNFFGEILTIATPSPYHLDYIDNIEVYLESYICCDGNNKNNINSMLTYFYRNNRYKKMSFYEFINKRNVLTYQKPNLPNWIPIIFFKNQQEHSNFIEFVKQSLTRFDYSEILKKYKDKIDTRWGNQDSLLNCCIHFWAYDLYWDLFKLFNE